MNVVQPIPLISEGPQPLVQETPEGVPYPVHALGPLRDAVEAVHAVTQAPVAIPAQSALAIASLAVQGFANVEALGGSSPLSLYCLTIARSGERKSSCDAKLMAALRTYERASHSPAARNGKLAEPTRLMARRTRKHFERGQKIKGRKTGCGKS
ncbi:DUF3987 domain-containing protein [Yoonia sp. I 8.24]|nr:DUF3987 domain-containing protein [Yoonia sp. I 8.24]